MAPRHNWFGIGQCLSLKFEISERAIGSRWTLFIIFNFLLHIPHVKLTTKQERTGWSSAWQCSSRR